MMDMGIPMAFMGEKRNAQKKTEWEGDTFPETNIAPKNGWLEYYFPIGFRPIFRCYVSFREGT